MKTETRAIRLLTIAFLLATLVNALDITKTKVQIKENTQMAQLSLFLQISSLHSIKKGSTFEKDLVQLMKESLYQTLKQGNRLVNHKRFTHIFVSAINASMEEEVLALLSKTPLDSHPVISIFMQPEESPIANSMQKPTSMFEQLDQIAQDE